MSRNIPKLRFKGFSGEWKEYKLGDISDKVTEKNKNNTYSETLTNSAEYGIINQRDFFEKDISNKKNLDGYYIVRPDDFVYNPRISNQAPVGPIKRNNLGRTGVMSPLYHVFRVHDDVNKSYLETYFSSNGWHKFMRLNGDSGARSDRFAIKDSVFREMPIPLPLTEEQERIGDFLKELDDTIALQKQLVDQQQQYKKAMIQKMFPQKGEHVPKIRFEGFSGKWEIRKMSDLVTPVVREVPKPNHSYKRLSVRSHAKGTFQQMVEDPSTVSMDKLYIVKENDLVVNITFAWEHAIAVAKTEDDGLFVSHRFPTFIIDKSDINFIHQLVSRENFRRKMDLISPGGAGRNRVLNKNDFIKLKVLIPKSIEEQQKIGSFFKQLDDTVILHWKKLEDYQQLKKALLQRMFV